MLKDLQTEINMLKTMPLTHHSTNQTPHPLPGKQIHKEKHKTWNATIADKKAKLNYMLIMDI